MEDICNCVPMALEGLLLTVYRKVTDDKVRMDAGKRGTMCSNMKKKKKKKKKNSNSTKFAWMLGSEVLCVVI
jgi:hypothetical protein